MCFHPPSQQHFIRPISSMDSLKQACPKAGALLRSASHPTQHMLHKQTSFSCCKTRQGHNQEQRPVKMPCEDEMQRIQRAEHFLGIYSTLGTGLYSPGWESLHFFMKIIEQTRPPVPFSFSPSHLSMGKKFQGMRPNTADCNNIHHTSQSVMSTEVCDSTWCLC